MYHNGMSFDENVPNLNIKDFLNIKKFNYLEGLDIMKTNFLRAIISALLLFASQVSAGTYYVSATATGSGNGSQANPWTLSQAISNVPEGTLSNENKVYLSAGAYSYTNVSFNKQYVIWEGKITAQGLWDEDGSFDIANNTVFLDNQTSGFGTSLGSNHSTFRKIIFYKNAGSRGLLSIGSPTYLTLDSCNVVHNIGNGASNDHSTRVSGGSHVTFKNCHFVRGCRTGIWVMKSHFFTMENCYLTAMSNHPPIQIMPNTNDPDTVTIKRPIVRNCIFKDSPYSDGIYSRYCEQFAFYNNLFIRSSTPMSIDCHTGFHYPVGQPEDTCNAKGGIIAYNTIIENGTQNIYFNIGTNQINFLNNIYYNTNAAEFFGRFDSPNNAIYRHKFDYNLYYATNLTFGGTNTSRTTWGSNSYWWNDFVSSGKETHTLVNIAPTFKNLTGDDYTPLNSSSPQVGKGTPITTANGYWMNITTDFFGNQRDPIHPTLGAIEFGASGGGDVTPPQVVSASLINSTTLVINFSETLNASTAQNKNNYIINNGISVLSAVLTGTQVTLTTSTHVSGAYTVTVNNVTDLAGNVINPNYKTANYNYTGGDVTPPQVVNASLTNSTKLIINFSESLNSSTAQNINNYSINNGISVVSALLSGSQVTLTTTAHVSGAYTVTVNNVTDLAGNVINPNFKTANYNYSSGDVTPPQVISAVLTSSTQLVINFSETLNSITAQNKNNYLISNSISVLSAVLSGTQVTLTTSAHVSGAYTVTVNNVTDLAGNVIDPQHNSTQYQYQPSPILVKLQICNVRASVTPEPTHTGEKTNDGKGCYSGDPDSRWAGDTMPEWLVYDLGAVRILNSTKLSFYKWDAGRTYNYTIQISTDSISWTAVKTNVVSLPQEWTQEIVGPINARYIKIIYLSNNQNTWAGLWEAEFWGNTGDIAPPQVVSAALTNSTKLVINFSEALNSTSAQNKNNYTISNGVSVVSAVLSGTQVTLTTSAHIAGSYMVTVNNVTDLAGNVIDPLHKTANYNYVTDTTPPYFTRLTVTNSTSLTINFSEKVDPVKAQNKINYSINNNIVINSAQLLPDSSSVLLSTSYHSRNKDYTLTISNITDRAGNVISPNPKSVIYRRSSKGSGPTRQNPLVKAIASNWNQNYLPEKAIDNEGMNNPDSRWMSNAIMPDTISFDMGNIYSLDSLQISFYKWESNRLYKYSLSCSKDSLNWDAVVTDVWSDSLEWTAIEFDSTQARFLKLILLENNQSSTSGIWEIKLFGPEGVTNVNNETETPNSYTLSQNYPNPFNPSTKIIYIIPEKTNVNLKIFDLLGAEVVELINGEMEPGKYSVEFNASNLPSGIYLYRLQAGLFVQTRKMILLK
jgi:hypothetical protein